ncbi:hypothetical protein ECP03048165_1085 [Escherichia coli P0304816.5]|nr:hypothetical protein ECP03048165_1085 [Escherichia coli P0304816.5]
MDHILAASNPLKIIYSVVRLDSIYVVYLRKRVWIINECSRH